MQRIIYNPTGWIGLVAPSSCLDPKVLEKSLGTFGQWGFTVCASDRLVRQERYLAGDDENRASGFLEVLQDPKVSTLWCARGGYGATRIISLLEKAHASKFWKKNAKLLLGFSDATALHLYAHKIGVPTVHAPMPASNSWNKMGLRTQKILQQMIRGQLPTKEKSYTRAWRLKNWGSTKPVEGLVVGGNLTLVANSIGTLWQPDLRGKILFLEDCGERPYRVDRMLTHMENAGMLKGLAGVLLGDFQADVTYVENREKRYWRSIFHERFEHLPILTGLPVGHGAKNEPLPLGVKVEISKQGVLTLLNQPVFAE